MDTFRGVGGVVVEDHRSPELGHSCRALAISVLAMFFSPARNSSLTDSNLVDGIISHLFYIVLKLGRDFDRKGGARRGGAAVTLTTDRGSGGS